jgi:hypothetical protein
MHSPDSGSSSEGLSAGPLPAGITAPSLSAPSQEAAGLLPLIDAAVLDELEDELAGTGLAKRFAMVGGVRLAKLAELLETLIRLGDFGQGKVLMERVAMDGGLTITELQSTYILGTD